MRKCPVNDLWSLRSSSSRATLTAWTKEEKKGEKKRTHLPLLTSCNGERSNFCNWPNSFIGIHWKQLCLESLRASFNGYNGPSNYSKITLWERERKKGDHRLFINWITSWVTWFLGETFLSFYKSISLSLSLPLQTCEEFTKMLATICGKTKKVYYSFVSPAPLIIRFL